MPGESVGIASRLLVFKVHGEVYRFMGSMRQQHADGLQTFFVDAAMQADIDK